MLKDTENADCKISYVNILKTILCTTTAKDYQDLRRYLTSTRTEFNTYTSKNQTKIILVLKGIHLMCNADYLIKILKTDSIAVKNARLYRADNVENKCNSFVVELDNGVNLTEVLKI